MSHGRLARIIVGHRSSSRRTRTVLALLLKGGHLDSDFFFFSCVHQNTIETLPVNTITSQVAGRTGNAVYQSTLSPLLRDISPVVERRCFRLPYLELTQRHCLSLSLVRRVSVVVASALPVSFRVLGNDSCSRLHAEDVAEESVWGRDIGLA